jgi:hypothetical protein
MMQDTASGFGKAAAFVALICQHLTLQVWPACAQVWLRWEALLAKNIVLTPCLRQR